MSDSSGGSERHGRTGVLAVGAGAFAVFCCAGLPLVASLVGGLTLAGVLGVSAGVLIAAAAVATAVVALRTRRRRSAASSTARTGAKL